MRSSAGHLRRQPGFTLVELMIVVSVIGILFSLAIPTYFNYRKKAKAAEAPVILQNIRELEYGYFAENDTYTNDLNLLNFKVEGRMLFTYEVVGATATGFTARATGNIDRDADVDTWTINDLGDLKHLIRD